MRLRKSLLGRIDGTNQFGGDMALELLAPVAEKEYTAFDDAEVVVGGDFWVREKYLTGFRR